MQEKIIQLIEEKSGSKTFCVLPWIHFATRPNGDMRLCCTANASGAGEDHHVGLNKHNDGAVVNLAKTSPMSAWNTQFMRDVRLKMINERVPKSCTKCFEEENKGIISKRLWETYSWIQDGVVLQDLVQQTTSDGDIPKKLIYLDLRLGHTCNLKCVMCSPHDSSRWTQDYEAVTTKSTIPIIKQEMSWNSKEFDNTWYEKPGFWEDIYSQIPNLRQVYFAGGEPLMIKEHKMFLKEIIKQGYEKNIYLRYNSNGLLLDDEILELWNQFRRVKFNFSIDALDQRNWFIRYPSDWNIIIENLKKLDSTADHIDVNIAVAVQALNIKHLPDMIKWKINQNYRKINMSTEFDVESGGGIINTHLVYIPTWFDVRVLPEEDKIEVRKLFGQLAAWLYEHYRQDEDFWKKNPYGWKRWQAILDFMSSKDHSDKLPALKDYISTLDQIRHTDFKTIFPELKHLV
jgi:MoaA/NifB/PqqE/SkfB family radical SAM enzyme